MSSVDLAEATLYTEAAEELRKNSDQWAAYESSGNCVVVAGPGSGKTKLLTIKMARLIAEDVEPPHGVACITYNTECARELRTRLRRLGVSEASRVFIGTSHSFCLQHILRPYASIIPNDLPDELSVASFQRQALALEQAMGKMLPYAPPPVSEFRIRMDRYRRTFLDRTAAEWKEVDTDVAAVIERYEEILHSAGFIDFDDMVLTGLAWLGQHQWLQKALKAKFPILLVDEYQDLGHPLHQIVLDLLNAGVRLFAVGDPDQSIYGFTGAEPRLLEDLSHLPGIERVPLRLNYRSRRLIVRGSQIVLQEDRGYQAAPAEGDDTDDGLLEFVECPDGLEEQADVTFDHVIPRALGRRGGRTLGDIAVLYPDRNVGEVVAQAADARSIPVVRLDQGAPYPKTPLTRWLEDCATWCAGAWREGGDPPLSDLLARGQQFDGHTTSEAVRWQGKVDLTRFLWSNREPAMPLSSWLDGMSAAFLAARLTPESESQDEVEVWERLVAASKEDGSLSNLTVALFGGQVGAPDHLNLITLHSAKGLEFDVVVMVGMDQGRIPSWAATNDEAKREPRRLFYVGMTRARHEVYMMYSGFTVNKFGRRFDNGPSEFLLELQQAIDSQSPTEV